MTELEQILIGDGYAAPPSHILEGLTEELTHKKPAGAPRSVYEELWHVVFWQQVTLDWVEGVETPFPTTPADGFPTALDMEKEAWSALCDRFSRSAEAAAAIAGDESRLSQTIRCPSRPPHPVRVMSVRDQLENLAAHNAYHLGRIVLLRQLLGAWPPKSGGFSW